MTRSHGRKVSRLERAAPEPSCDVHIRQEQQRLGHGTAAISKVMPNGRATAIAAARFRHGRQTCAPARNTDTRRISQSCALGPRVSFLAFTILFSTRRWLQLRGGVCTASRATHVFGSLSLSTTPATSAGVQWKDQRAKDTWNWARALWGVCLGPSGLISAGAIPVSTREPAT